MDLFTNSMWGMTKIDGPTLE
ncbi:hypothetical protein FRAAL0815 [Frankia alni ACN14a]|uniref:Uncharacterized protein n=1 Tax=Frankia alni (strain DSM 45986 / CECT 9034 / ACN14a) TaxID=326424 RepID=Q0RSH8_FRAAA|nr:hypothetical protein FRAAL0815 [Frankia alni ACN14a]